MSSGWLKATLGAAVAVALSASALAQDNLPPEAQKRLMERDIADVLEAKDYAGALRLLGQYRAKFEEAPFMILLEARAALNVGRLMLAKRSAEEFLAAAKADDPDYDAGVDLYASIDKQLEAARKRRVTQAASVSPMNGDLVAKAVAARLAWTQPAKGDELIPFTFREKLGGGGEGPVMVVVPGGAFTMGSPDKEAGRYEDEGPQRRVTVPAFAAGKYEVTWDEYEQCVADDACAPARDDGWGKADRPVTDVSWHDARAYVDWLSSRTGATYRLLSEAEWEYAARAGTITPFSFGATISTAQANYNGDYTYGSGKKGLYREQTTPVGSFPANAFGLHDMHGNVAEWVEDCYEENYSSGQPSDGRALINGSCSSRVLRSGSWKSGPRGLRSAYRDAYIPTNRFSIFGFRVARTL
ncbi:MAG: SUMF1/EgtB/PvdO family nonheme iron enzyme [Hyphomonadaceae bacterium]